MKIFFGFGLVVVITITVITSSLAAKLGRVTGGENTLIGEAAYIVYFSNGSLFCTGSIIHPNWVLTVSHCLIPDNFTVIAGLHLADPNFNDPYVQRRHIPDYTYIVEHDSYYYDPLDGVDAALVFIEEPFNVTGSIYVTSVGMPLEEYESIPPGPATLYGWGYTSSGELAEELQNLKTNIITFGDCKEMLDIPLNEYNMCTEGPYGICTLDSGSPLVRKTDHGIELIGIASWGESPCNSRTSPSVYTRVDKLMGWIHKTLAEFKLLNRCIW